MGRTDNYAKDALIAWEKLRVVYNAVLLFEGFGGLWILRNVGRAANHLCANVFDASIWFPLVLLVGVSANALYFFGWGAEVFAERSFGFRFGRRRLLLFGAGLLFSMFIVFCFFMRGWVHISGFLKH